MLDGALGAKLLKAMVEAGRPQTIRVSGNSMWPLIEDGECVVVDTAPKPEVGDVVVFRHEGRLLIHRMIGMRGGVIFAKGDNAFMREEITREQVIGRPSLIQTRDGRSLEVIKRRSDRMVAAVLSGAVSARFRKKGSVEAAKKGLGYRLLQSFMSARRKKMLLRAVCGSRFDNT